MTMATAMPGEIEVAATTNYIEKNIAVCNEDIIVINRYGEQLSSSKGMVHVQFTRIGDDVGHYDLLVSQEYPTSQTMSLKIIFPVPQSITTTTVESGQMIPPLR